MPRAECFQRTRLLYTRHTLRRAGVSGAVSSNDLIDYLGAVSQNGVLWPFCTDPDGISAAG